MFEVTVKHPTFINPQLHKATDAIFRLGESIRINQYQVAAIIAGVDASECYKDDGFDSVHDWVTKTFGFGKSQSYDLLKVGREYTRKLVDDRGRTKAYECNLLPEGSPENFTASQVAKLLPVGHDKAEELVKAGVVTPRMTCKEIAKAVKDPDGVVVEGEMSESEAHEASKEKKPSKLEKLSTSDLIRELNRRGYTVHDDSGKEVTPIEEAKEGDNE